MLNVPMPEVVLQRSEEHTSELQSPCNIVCRLLLERKNVRKGFYQEKALNKINTSISRTFQQHKYYLELLHYVHCSSHRCYCFRSHTYQCIHRLLALTAGVVPLCNICSMQ